MTEPHKSIMAWGDYGPESVTGQWSANTYDRDDTVEYVLKSHFEMVRLAADIGLKMAEANDLWNTAETIKSILSQTTNAQRGPLGAAWMRNQAAHMIIRIAEGYEAGGDGAIACAMYLTAGNFRAIPDPTPADLLALALKLPEIAALVDAARALHSDMLERAKIERDENGNETGRLVSAGRSVWYDFDAALAPLGAAMSAAIADKALAERLARPCVP